MPFIKDIAAPLIGGVGSVLGGIGAITASRSQSKALDQARSDIERFGPTPEQVTFANQTLTNLLGQDVLTRPPQSLVQPGVLPTSTLAAIQRSLGLPVTSVGPSAARGSLLTPPAVARPALPSPALPAPTSNLSADVVARAGIGSDQFRDLLDRIFDVEQRASALNEFQEVLDRVLRPSAETPGVTPLPSIIDTVTGQVPGVTAGRFGVAGVVPGVAGAFPGGTGSPGVTPLPGITTRSPAEQAAIDLGLIAFPPGGTIPSVVGLPIGSLAGLREIAERAPVTVTPEGQDLSRILNSGDSAAIARGIAQDLPGSPYATENAVDNLRGQIQTVANPRGTIEGNIISKATDYAIRYGQGDPQAGARAVDLMVQGKAIMAPGAAAPTAEVPARALGGEIIDAARAAARGGEAFTFPLETLGLDFLGEAFQPGAASPFYRRAAERGLEQLRSGFALRNLLGSQDAIRAEAEFLASLEADQAAREFSQRQAALGTTAGLMQALQGQGLTGLGGLISGFTAGQALPQQEAAFRLAQTQGQAELADRALGRAITLGVTLPETLRATRLQEATQLGVTIPEALRQARLGEALQFGIQVPSALEAQRFGQELAAGQFTEAQRQQLMANLLAFLGRGQGTANALAGVQFQQAQAAGDLARLGIGGAGSALSFALQRAFPSPYESALANYLNNLGVSQFVNAPSGFAF